MTTKVNPELVSVPMAIADAFFYIATVNHYLVGFKGEEYTVEELEQAKQLLINRSNNAENKCENLEMALDFIELEIKKRMK